MGKAVKIFLVLALLVSVSGFAMSVVTAQEAGLSVTEVADRVKSNMKKMNMGIFISEYNDVKENLSIQSQGEITNLVILTTFPDVAIQQGGSELIVHLDGDVSSEVRDLLSEKRLGKTAFIKIANVFNENPSSRGLNATIIVPDGIEQIKVTSISGSILVDEIELDQLDLESKSGTIEVMNSEAGRLKAQTTSGHISVFGCKDVAVDLASGSGDIITKVGKISGGMATKSGALNVDFVELTEDLSLKSESGLINIMYQGDDVVYDFSDSKGWIKNSNPNSTLRQGRIGSGTHHLRAKSISNGIIFSYSQDEIHN